MSGRQYDLALRASKFSEAARDGTKIATTLQDGSMKVLLKPTRSRDFNWHRPVLQEPEIQWTPETGMTIWEWVRRGTPPDQADLLRELGDRVRLLPPSLPPQDLWDLVDAKRDDEGVLPNGLPGVDLGAEIHKKLRSYVYETYSPDCQWRVSVQAVRLSKSLVADRIDVRHCDYRTLPDWTLMKRIRAWLLEDDRDCFLYMPGQRVGTVGWEHRYENATPNNLSMVAPRWKEEQ